MLCVLSIVLYFNNNSQKQVGNDEIKSLICGTDEDVKDVDKKKKKTIEFISQF